MSGKVEVVMTAKDAELVRAWQRSRESVEAFNDELDKTGKTAAKVADEGDKAGRALETSFGSRVSSAISGGMAMMEAFRAVIAQVKAEFEDLEKRQAKAAGKQLTVADAQSQALQNLGVGTGLSGQDLEKQIARISRKTGASQEDLYAGAANAFAARGTLTPQQALEGVEAAAMISPRDGGALATMSGAVNDLRKVGGGTAAENAGLQAQIMGASRVKSLDLISTNLVPTINGLQKYGDSREQSAELVAALSQSLSDQQGSTTATAASNLAAQLQAAVPGKNSTAERMEFVQSDAGKKIREKLIGKDGKGGSLTGDAKSLPSMRALLSADNTPEKQQLAQARQAIEGGAAAENAFKAHVGFVNSTELQKTAQFSARTKATEAAIQLQDQRGARTAIGREAVENIGAASGAGYHERWIPWGFYEARTAMGMDPMKATRAGIQEEAGMHAIGRRKEGHTESDSKEIVSELRNLNRNLSKMKVEIKMPDPAQVPVRPPAAAINNRNKNPGGN